MHSDVSSDAFKTNKTQEDTTLREESFLSGSAMYTEVIDTHTAEPIGQFVWHMTRLLRGESATGGSAFCHLAVVSNHSPCRSRQGFSMDQPQRQMGWGEEVKLLGQTWMVP